MLTFVNAKIITVAGRGAHHKATLIGPSKVKEGCPELSQKWSTRRNHTFLMSN